MTRPSLMSHCSLILFTVFSAVTTTWAGGINCDGSLLCPLATLEQASDHIEVMQAFRSAMRYTDLPDSTAYYEHDHIICISNELSIVIGPKIGPIRLGVSLGFQTGGICMFPENLSSGTSITLAQARNFTDEILGHGCTTCGGVPINYPKTNNVLNGELKIDYVATPICTGNCIWENNHQATAVHTVTSSAVVVSTAYATQATTVISTKYVTPTVVASTSASVRTSSSSITSSPSFTTLSPPTTPTQAQFVSSNTGQATVTVTAARSSGGEYRFLNNLGVCITVAALVWMYHL